MIQGAQQKNTTSAKAETPDQTQWLVDLARQKSQSGREELFRNVWDLFENRGNTLSVSERTLMLDILRQLSHDVEMAVRVKLAQRLAKQSGAPHELITLLANDSIEVAHPILMDSKVLQDVDLIEIVRQRSLQHQLVVSLRPEISANVCDALADTGNDSIIVNMLNNETANVSYALIEKLASESKVKAGFQEPLLRRPGLPADVAQKMYGWVSAALRQYITSNYQIDPDALDDTLSDSFIEAVSEAKADEADDPAQRLVDKLHKAGKLSISFALKAIREGDVNLFELTLAKLTQLRPRLLRRILYEKGGEGLVITCRSIGIDRSVFLTIFELSRAARGESISDDTIELDKVRALFDRMNPDSALRVLRKWQRDPAFLAAIKQVDEGA